MLLVIYYKKPSTLAYLSQIIKMSKKVFNAEDQQERLMKIGWIVGFVDGEGCFSVNIVKQNERKEKNRIRKGYKTGFQIMHEFAVTQGEKSLSSLNIIKDFFGVGGLYVNRRYDNHKENLYRYCVRKREDLSNVIIPFFEKNILQTSKANDFRLFVEIIRDMEKDLHLTKSGLIKIVNLMQLMNHKKDRSEIIRILRNQTSD